MVLQGGIRIIVTNDRIHRRWTLAWQTSSVDAISEWELHPGHGAFTALGMLQHNDAAAFALVPILCA